MLICHNYYSFSLLSVLLLWSGNVYSSKHSSKLTVGQAIAFSSSKAATKPAAEVRSTPNPAEIQRQAELKRKAELDDRARKTAYRQQVIDNASNRLNNVKDVGFFIAPERLIIGNPDVAAARHRAAKAATPATSIVTTTFKNLFNPKKAAQGRRLVLILYFVSLFYFLSCSHSTTLSGIGKVSK